MIVQRPSEQDVQFVLENLRDLDRRELTAAGANFDFLPMYVMAGSVFAFSAVDDLMMPHAIWGMMPSRKGVGAGFAFGTNYWGKALPAIMRNIRDFVLPFLLEHGYHRVECQALSHRRDVERFLELIGAHPEGTLSQWGIGGEDFTSYRWLADEHRNQAHKTINRHVSH
jgi:hypothetical protein